MNKISSFDANCCIKSNFVEYNKKNSKIIMTKPIPRGAGLSPRLLSASENYQSIILTNKILTTLPKLEYCLAISFQHDLSRCSTKILSGNLVISN